MLCVSGSSFDCRVCCPSWFVLFGLFCLCVGYSVFCVAYGSDSVYALRGKFRYPLISSVARKVVVRYVVLH